MERSPASRRRSYDRSAETRGVVSTTRHLVLQCLEFLRGRCLPNATLVSCWPRETALMGELPRRHAPQLPDPVARICEERPRRKLVCLQVWDLDLSLDSRALGR